MRLDNLLGNILWFIFGGFISALCYFIGGALLCLTIIGIPFGVQCFKLGIFVLRPFGLQAVQTEKSSGCLSVILNILWLLWTGLGIAIIHIAFGCLLCITFVLFPFGMQHFKMVEVALLPFGKKIVPKK